MLTIKIACENSKSQLAFSAVKEGYANLEITRVEIIIVWLESKLLFALPEPNLT